MISFSLDILVLDFIFDIREKKTWRTFLLEFKIKYWGEVKIVAVTRKRVGENVMSFKLDME